MLRKVKEKWQPICTQVSYVLIQLASYTLYIPITQPTQTIHNVNYTGEPHMIVYTMN